MTISRTRFLKNITLTSLGAAGLILSAAASAQSMDANSQQQAQEQAPSSDVRVQEEPAQVDVQQPAPRVEAEQQPMDVQVQTGEPEVSVEQQDPEVSIDQPDPEVRVEQREPEVVIQDAEPEVQVNQEEPEVTVEGAEPEVEIISLDEEGQRREEDQAAQQDEAAAARFTSSSSQNTQELEQVSLTELQGKTVRTGEGDELGSVEDVVAQNQGGEAGFVVSVGGFFGIGESKLFVPASEAQLQNDEIVWQTQKSKDELKNSEAYDETDYVSVTNQYESLEAVNRDAVSAR